MPYSVVRSQGIIISVISISAIRALCRCSICLIYSPIAKEDRFRFIEALGQNSEVAKFIAPTVTAVESTAITNLYLNKIVAGEISIVDGLNQAAEELHKITADNGMKTGMLPKLK